MNGWGVGVVQGLSRWMNEAKVRKGLRRVAGREDMEKMVDVLKAQSFRKTLVKILNIDIHPLVFLCFVSTTAKSMIAFTLTIL